MFLKRIATTENNSVVGNSCLTFSYAKYNLWILHFKTFDTVPVSLLVCFLTSHRVKLLRLIWEIILEKLKMLGKKNKFQNWIYFPLSVNTFQIVLTVKNFLLESWPFYVMWWHVKPRIYSYLCVWWIFLFIFKQLLECQVAFYENK